MMRFLQRQRKSIRSGEFFKCHLCLLLIAAMLVAAALPNGVRESGPLDSVKRMGQTGGQEFCPDRKQTGTMVAAPNEERPEVEAAGRELSDAHVIETLRQKSAYRYWCGFWNVVWRDFWARCFFWRGESAGSSGN